METEYFEEEPELSSKNIPVKYEKLEEPRKRHLSLGHNLKKIKLPLKNNN